MSRLTTLAQQIKQLCTELHSAVLEEEQCKTATPLAHGFSASDVLAGSAMQQVRQNEREECIAVVASYAPEEHLSHPAESAVKSAVDWIVETIRSRVPATPP